MELTLSDPTYAPPDRPRLSERVALRFIHDARDVPFLGLSALLTLVFVPSAVWLFLPGHFNWWVACARFGLVLWFLGPYILMLHNTSHRRFFKGAWSKLNFYVPCVLGPLFGESPETYFAHHVGMHHPENNMGEDLSSTLPYVRDSFFAFARYFARFFFGAIYELPAYFARKRRRTLFLKALLGELSWYALVIGLSFVSVRATFMVFIVPYLTTRLLMMCGNWGQHAFVDRAEPENCYRNSITCINTVYNRRCFNDGYHIGHHVKATRHWTEMPDDFLRNVKKYADEGAVVFEGIDFFGVWVCLMLKRYDWLARRYVSLDGAKKPEAEIVALLQSRTRWTRTKAA